MLFNLLLTLPEGYEKKVTLNQVHCIKYTTDDDLRSKLMEIIRNPLRSNVDLRDPNVYERPSSSSYNQAAKQNLVRTLADNYIRKIKLLKHGFYCFFNTDGYSKTMVEKPIAYTRNFVNITKVSDGWVMTYVELECAIAVIDYQKFLTQIYQSDSHGRSYSKLSKRKIPTPVWWQISEDDIADITNEFEKETEKNVSECIEAVKTGVFTPESFRSPSKPLPTPVPRASTGGTGHVDRVSTGRRR